MMPPNPYPAPLGAGNLPSPQTAEYGGPQCYTGQMGDDAASGTELKSDRRVVKAAVVDCTNVGSGSVDITAKGFVELFVLTPWDVNGGKHEIYTEIIGPIGDGINSEVAKVIVQLYE